MNTPTFIALFFAILLVQLVPVESTWGESLVNKRGRLRKLESQIQGLQRKLDGEQTFTIKSRLFNTEEQKLLRRFKVVRNTLAEECSLGVSLKVLSVQGRPQERFAWEGPLFLEQVESLEREQKNTEENIGYGLKFRPQDKVLYFSSFRERNLFQQQTKKLIDLCQRRNEIMADIREMENQCQDQRKDLSEVMPMPASAKEMENMKEPLSIPVAHGLGARPLHLQTKERNQDMQVALLSGLESFAYRIKSAKEAKESINVQTFHWMGDEAGLEIGNTLIEKKQQGVDVQVMLDYFTPFIDIRVPRDRANTYILYNNMMAAGIPVYGYSCTGGFTHYAKEIINSYKIGDPWNHRLSIHEKIWLVDGKEAIIGGLNIHNSYYQIAPDGKTNWRDQDILIKGQSLLEDLKNIFDGNVKTYQNNRVGPLDKKCLNPHPVGSPAYKTFLKKHTKKYKLPALHKRSAKTKFALKEIEKLKQGEVKGQPFTPELLPIEAGRIIHSRPDIGESYIEDAYLDLIEKSQKEIWLVNAYFIPTPRMIEALNKAAARGVKIRILTNSKDTNDPFIVSYAANYHFKELVDKNHGTPSEVELYEWTGKDKNTGKQMHGMLHAKLGIFDEKVVIVGSYNFDAASRTGNNELVLAYQGEELAKILKNHIENKDLTLARKLDYATILQYRRPRGMKKVFDRVLLQLAKKFEDKM